MSGFIRLTQPARTWSSRSPRMWPRGRHHHDFGIDNTGQYRNEVRWNEELSSQLLPTKTSGQPRVCHNPGCPSHGPLCGFDPVAIQSSICFMQVSLDESGSTLQYVPGKNPCLKTPPLPSTSLAANTTVFQKGFKDSSIDEQKQWELPDDESKAVQPPAVQAISINDPGGSQAVASNRCPRLGCQRPRGGQPTTRLTDADLSSQVRRERRQPYPLSHLPSLG